MALAHSPSTVASGLTLCVDAANPLSYLLSATGSLTFAANSRVRLPTTTALQFASGDFTVEFWMNAGSTQTAFATITDSSTNNQAIAIGVGTNLSGIAGRLSFSVFGGTGTLNSTTPVLDNTWRHIACVKSGAVGRLFVNGILEASTTNWSGVTNAFLSGGCLGGSAFGGGNNNDNFFAGSIANFAVYNTALYTTNFAVPTAPPSVVPVLQLLYNATSAATYIADSSTNNFTSTIASGTPAYSAASPFNGAKSSLSTVEVLVVAGGGAGGAAENNTNGGGGGGGGAGGVVYSPSAPVTAGIAYTVTVGSGGLSNSLSLGYGGNGNNSSFSTLTAIGGGGGGGGDLEGSAAIVVASSGGSGGGAGGDVTTENQALGTPGQGNAGGARGGPGNNRAGAGGGGAGQTGFSGTRGINNTGLGGTGGNGVSYSISGTATFYGGGGGGGGCQNASSGVKSSTGGLGGGGAGAGDAAAVAGTANTGGGGGGGYGAFGVAGGNGGSGVVIIRYPGVPQATGGTITSVDGFTIHTFTSSGTFTTLSSAVWSDVSGQGNNGICVNSPTFNSANAGFLQFNGTNQYATLGNVSLGTSNITVMAWVFDTDVSNLTRDIVTKNGQFKFRIDSGAEGGNLSAFVWIAGTPEPRISTAWTKNVWTQVAFTWSNSGAFNLYTNGVLRASTAGRTGTLGTSSDSLLVGASTTSADFWNGNISNVIIYNAALTAAEINQNFNALRGRYGI
jgi:hypothetical protein